MTLGHVCDEVGLRDEIREGEQRGQQQDRKRVRLDQAGNAVGMVATGRLPAGFRE